MNIVYENDIKRDISSENFAPVYLFYGDDSYLKKHYTDILIKKIAGEDEVFNLSKFERNIDLQIFYDAVNQMPMFSDKKCVLVDDYDFEHDEKSVFDSVCELLSDVGNNCIVILKFDAIELDLKKNQKAKKLLSSVEKSGGKAVLLNHRSTGELKAMLIRGAKKRGFNLPDSVATYIIESVGEDINTLKNELDKLCFFCENGEINKENVDFVCSKTVEASVYDYVREIINCNITNALKMLDNMFYNRIEPMAILGTVSSSFIDIYRVMSAPSSLSKEQIINDFDYKNKAFLIDKAKQNSKKFNSLKIEKCLKTLLEADKIIKSFSFNEKIILEELTVKLGVIIATGGEDID